MSSWTFWLFSAASEIPNRQSLAIQSTAEVMFAPLEARPQLLPVATTEPLLEAGHNLQSRLD
jgi:hypothetical protein